MRQSHCFLEHELPTISLPQLLTEPHMSVGVSFSKNALLVVLGGPVCSEKTEAKNQITIFGNNANFGFYPDRTNEVLFPLQGANELF